jgi:hypothetical protein
VALAKPRTIRSFKQGISSRPDCGHRAKRSRQAPRQKILRIDRGDDKHEHERGKPCHRQPSYCRRFIGAVNILWSLLRKGTEMRQPTQRHAGARNDRQEQRADPDFVIEIQSDGGTVSTVIGASGKMIGGVA